MSVSNLFKKLAERILQPVRGLAGVGRGAIVRMEGGRVEEVAPYMCSVIWMEAGQHKQLVTITITTVWPTHIPSQIPDREDVFGRFDSLSSPSLGVAYIRTIVLCNSEMEESCEDMIRLLPKLDKNTVPLHTRLFCNSSWRNWISSRSGVVVLSVTAIHSTKYGKIIPTTVRERVLILMCIRVGSTKLLEGNDGELYAGAARFALPL